MTDPASSLYSVRMRSFLEDRHLAGGEDIVAAEELPERITELLNRGLSPSTHDPGRERRPSLTFRIDPVDPGALVSAPLLPVHCLKSDTVSETWAFVRDALALLETQGFLLDSKHLLEQCRLLLAGNRPVSPGAFLLSPDGDPLDPDGRGIRVTHFGMLRRVREGMISQVAVHGTGTSRRFIEALQIASKALHSPPVLLEFCLSDNPEYTTGYLALKGVGYIRLPHLKPPGIPAGGRLYVMEKPVDSSLETLLGYLTKTPVLFTEESDVFPMTGSRTLLERIAAHRRTDG